MSSLVKEFCKIPGVGPSISRDFIDLGFSCVGDLSKQSAEDLYLKLCELRGEKIDRCVLYVFRCAIYFSENKDHDPEKLKWWNWKDRQ